MTGNEQHEARAMWEERKSTAPRGSKKELQAFQSLWMKLCQAAADGDANNTRKLLSEGACAAHGLSLPLCLAARNGHRECVALLIPGSSGWGVGQHSQGILSPLEEAAGQGRRECVELLISAPGIEPDAWAGLAQAAFWGQASCVNLLLPLIGAEQLEDLMLLAIKIERLNFDGWDFIVGMMMARREVLQLDIAAGQATPANRAPIRI